MLRAVLGGMWNRLITAWPPNRIVTVLGPLVFVPAAGWVAVKAAEWGLPPIDPGFLAGIFVAGALAGLTTIKKFIDGWIAYEAQLASPDQKPVLAKVHRVPPAEIKEGGVPLPPGGTGGEGSGGGIEEGPPDADFILSQPSDIAESDADDPDALARAEQEHAERPQ